MKMRETQPTEYECEAQRAKVWGPEGWERGDKCRQKSPSRHHRTTLSGYIFATKAPIDNRKTTC